jgi:hypothetical protein
MTPSSTPVQPLTLDPATFHTLISTTIDALPHHPKASPEEIATQQHAAFLIIASLRPRDPMEAMLAARVIAAHAHVMDNFRNAAQPDLPPNLQLHFQGRAIGLSRLMDVTLHEFWNRQTAPARQPKGLPVSVMPAVHPVTPAVHPQPAPASVRTDPPPAPPQAATPQKTTHQTAHQTAHQTDQKTAPAAPPAAPTPAPLHAKTASTSPPVAGPTPLDPAKLAQLAAEVEAGMETSSIALAA